MQQQNETQLNDLTAPGLRRAVVHAAAEINLLGECALDVAPEARLFYAGVRAAADAMDITFKRYFAGMDPSAYAHTLERGYQVALMDKAAAADIIRSLLAGDRTVTPAALDWLANNTAGLLDSTVVA